MPICQNCKKKFLNKIKKKGKIYNLTGRKFCLECSPLGGRNTRSYIIELKENEAFCARCNQIKDKKEFYLRKNSKPFSYCRKCQDEVKKIKFEEKLETLIEHFGAICQDCQNSYPIPIYEFFKDGKSYSIGKIKNMSLKRAMIELQGSILLCKNCKAIRDWQNEI